MHVLELNMGSLYEGLNQTGKVLDKIIYKALRMLMEKWNMNNGALGFAEFYAQHPRCKFDEALLLEMVSINKNGVPEEYDEEKMEIYDVNEALNDSWLQQQYARWFEGTDRFVNICQYHLADENKLFFNWLIRK